MSAFAAWVRLVGLPAAVGLFVNRAAELVDHIADVADSSQSSLHIFKSRSLKGLFRHQKIRLIGLTGKHCCPRSRSNRLPVKGRLSCSCNSLSVPVETYHISILTTDRWLQLNTCHHKRIITNINNALKNKQLKSTRGLQISSKALSGIFSGRICNTSTGIWKPT